MDFSQINIVNRALSLIPQEVLPMDGNYNGTYFPGIDRVVFNDDTTIVFFTDNTKCTVECSSGDKYDRQTALAYAVCKRLFGTIGKKDKNGVWHENEIDGNGFGCYMKKLVDAGYDQQKEEAAAEARKRDAKKLHEKMQAAQKKAAFQRKVEERAEQIRIEEAARALLDAEKAGKKTLNETASNQKHNCCSCKSNVEAYVRPDKPFSQFTPEEKRAYWREQNRKRRS